MSTLKYLSALTIVTFCTLAVVEAATTSSSAAKPSSSYLCNSPVFTTCYNSQKTILDTCSPADYTCNCDNLKAIINCYPHCPDDTSFQDQLSAYVARKDEACAKAPVISQTWTGSSTASATPAKTNTDSNTGITEAASGTPIKSNAFSTTFNNDQYLFAEKLLLAITAIAFCLAF
ncbi:2842_t:CDS:2 [Ambispora gerdemannii]|uniref:2842_t:CDS:1 n=1 Tax=Ambispora gerdemannii TaxID=144530 RepID=A0A9N9ECL7_9GLOM|nr:2842_t:CDS:2 [Ambispora gerdemannii]